ncbi:hypothetical protein CWO90_42965 [Bradyrhizobium sp. Leo121]|nr:hypothetical protein CWO90_42965 [Bradyrhizobium sp. Leo121]
MRRFNQVADVHRRDKIRNATSRALNLSIACGFLPNELQPRLPFVEAGFFFGALRQPATASRLRQRGFAAARKPGTTKLSAVIVRHRVGRMAAR